MQHYLQDPETKLYWNPKTQRWVKRINHRPSTKGQHIGKAKDKAKGLTAQKKLDQLLSAGVIIKAGGWLPAALSVKQIGVYMEQYRLNTLPSWKWEMEEAISLISLILSSYYYTRKKDRDSEWNDGYAQIQKNRFKKWVSTSHKQVAHYLKAFQDANVIAILSDYCSDSEKGYARRYRINSSLQTGKFKNKYISYKTPKMILKAYNISKERQIKNKVQETRKYIINEAKAMIQYIDLEDAKYEMENVINWPCVNRGKKKPMQSDEIYLRLVDLKNGRWYGNDKDDFGERLHTPWTNLPKIVKCWIRIPNVEMGELDICNSQFSFFASTAVNDRENVMAILKTSNNEKNLQYRKDLELIRYYYHNRLDFRSFCDEAIEGNLYEYLVDEFKKRGIMNAYGQAYDRDGVKKLCYRTLFSDDKQCKLFKEIMSLVFPSVVRLCEILNKDQRKAVPQTMQRLEARMMIDRICTAVYSAGIRNFFTVHDSIMCKAEDLPKVKEIFLQEFTKAGLTPPKFK